MSDARTFVIVGASLAGAKAAETLRDEGFTGAVIVIGEELEPPYERPPLSKGYLLGQQSREAAYVHERTWYEENGIELVLGRRVTMLDPLAHSLILDGVEEMRYDKLLLATGSRVRTLNVPGHELTGVRYLRTLDEADALLDALRDGGRQVVVVGAGWIGLEVAAAARGYGNDVTVVDVDRAPLRRVLGDEVATVFRRLHEANGVRFRFECGVREIGELDGRVASVVLDDNAELAADVIAVGIGIVPCTELAEAGQIDIDNGVVTDATLRTSDPDVYACGDVAYTFNPVIGARIRVEHWSNALNGGKAAARAMLGGQDPYDRVPYFFTDQYDLGMEYAGYVEPGAHAAVVFRGSPDIVDGKTPEFLAFWLDAENRVLAGMNVNIWEVNEDIQRLVRAKRPVDPDRLADPRVPLADLLA